MVELLKLTVGFAIVCGVLHFVIKDAVCAAILKADKLRKV